MSRELQCRAGRHRWVRKPGSSVLTCRDCGVTGRRRKTLFCYLGLHNWITTVSGGVPYLECRHCGHYGGSTGRLL